MGFVQKCFTKISGVKKSAVSQPAPKLIQISIKMAVQLKEGKNKSFNSLEIVHWFVNAVSHTCQNHRHLCYIARLV